jgi:hypothetical protein
MICGSRGAKVEDAAPKGVKNWARIWSTANRHHVEMFLTLSTVPDVILEPTVIFDPTVGVCGDRRDISHDFSPPPPGVWGDSTILLPPSMCHAQKTLPANLDRVNGGRLFSRGTRRVPSIGVFQTQFTLDFLPGDLPWDLAHTPFVTYGDGVLNITFVLGN